MRTVVARAVRGALLVGLLAAPAFGFDATGTWEGQFSCKHFNGAKLTFKMKPSILEITHIGQDLIAELDGDFHYRGRSQDDAKKPSEKGEAFLIQCGTDADAGMDLAEMLRAVIKTKPDKIAASFSGTSIIEADFGNGRQFGTCKYKFKRTATANPMALGCPV
jgi:hypothetical protein